MIRCERCGAVISPNWVVEIDGKPYHRNCFNGTKNTMDERTTEHLVAAVAMSLYKYNVSPGERAEKLLDHFKGACAEPDVLLRLVDDFNWATEMAAPTALWYMQHALDKYGSEAEERVQVNLEQPFLGDT